MLSNHRRVLQIAVIVNIFLLVYAALYLSSNTNVPPSASDSQWLPLTGIADNTQGDEIIMRSIQNVKNATDVTFFVSNVPITSLNNRLKMTTSTSPASAAPTALKLTNDLIMSMDSEAESNEMLLSEATLNKLRSLLECHERDFLPKTMQRGEYWALVNYVRADHGPLQCHETITYTTHAGFEFFDNISPLVERWLAPISIAVYAPGSDLFPAVDSIRYLRDCLDNDLIRQYVTFHVFFSNKDMPSSIPLPDEFLMQAYNCTNSAPFLNKTISTYMKKKSLLYPVNVARNIARDAALTHFVLASDIELYPSPNLVPSFLQMIARNDKPLNTSTNPRVFPITLFEVDAKFTVPSSKHELQAMLSKKNAIPFHKFVCPTCHNIPLRDEWIKAEESSQMDVFHVGKRQGKFVHWEPIYIGTHQDPYYDERLSWDGKKDKMTQGYILCVKDYDFMILNNAFLCHKPGIKHYKSDKKRNMIAGKQGAFVSNVIAAELKKLFGSRKGCSI